MYIFIGYQPTIIRGLADNGAASFECEEHRGMYRAYGPLDRDSKKHRSEAI